jgi:hypothetical protein
MSFRQVFKKTNNVHEAAKDFASCSCFANKTENIALFFRYCLICSVCFFIFAYELLCLSGIIGIIILNLLALSSILLRCKFTWKSQSAY